MGRSKRCVQYECVNSSCAVISSVTKRQKSGILVCNACGYPVKKVRDEKK